MVRYEGDDDQVVMASSGTFKAVFPTGSRHRLGGDNAASLVFRTGRSARIDDYGKASGPIAEAIRPVGLRGAVATPIMVEGRLWGAMIAGTTGEEPLPPETESRLGQFTELMATAIANTETRAHADRLTEEQAALPARGDAGREGGAAGGGVRQGRRGTGDRPRRCRVLAVSRRGRRNRARRRSLGRRRAGGRPSGHAAPYRRRWRHCVRAP